MLYGPLKALARGRIPAIPARRSSPVDIVPVDYVADRAYELVTDGPDGTFHLVAGRNASVNFDMQSLASLLHGDRITVSRSQHRVRFLHPRGWSYFDTLRMKLHWNEGN